MSVRLRTLSFVAMGLTLLAAAAYSAYWFHVAGEVRKGFDAWAAERRAAGWTVDAAAATVGGFPGMIDLELTAPSLSDGKAWSWRAEAVRARVSPADLTRVAVDMPGRHQVEAGPLRSVVDAGSLRVDLRLDRAGRVRGMGVAAASVTAAVPEAAGPLALAHLSTTIDSLPAQAPTHQTPTLAFHLSAQGVELPPLPGLLMERRVTLAEIGGRVLGELPSLRPSAIVAWSAAGGTVELDRVALDWAPLGLEGEGTVALDTRLQPLAALTARVSGWGSFMDRLARAGMVEQGPAAAAKMLMSLMSKPDTLGRPAVPVPVTLQDGLLYVGPARVLTVPPLPWAP